MQEDHFWLELIGALAMIVAMFVAPMLGAFLAGTAAAGLTFTSIALTALSAATIAGVIEAAGEGLLVGLGVEQEISLKRILTGALMAGISAGLGAGLGAGGRIGLESISQSLLVQAVLEQGIINITQQLTLMALGQQQHFSFASAAAAAAVGVIQAGASKAIGSIGSTVKVSGLERSFQTIAIKSVSAEASIFVNRAITGTPPTAANLLSSEIGVAANFAVHKGWQDPTAERHYMRSSKAKPGKIHHPKLIENEASEQHPQIKTKQRNLGSVNQTVEHNTQRAITNLLKETTAKLAKTTTNLQEQIST